MTTTLSYLCDRYISLHAYGLRASSAQQLRVSVRAWERFAGRQLSIDDLNHEAINKYLDWLLSHRAPDTFRTRRGNLLLLWRYAADEDFVTLQPLRIRRQRPIPRCPTAWTVDEVRVLIETAGDLDGRWRGCDWDRAAWTSSIIRAAYDTALRLDDLLSLRADVAVCPTWSVRQAKTGRILTVRVRTATLAAIDQAVRSHGQVLAWPLWGTRESFYRHIRAVVRLSGVRPGTFRWIRRAAVTALESSSPGMGTRLAGHASRSTTERHYIDAAQLDPPPLPPL